MIYFLWSINIHNFGKINIYRKYLKEQCEKKKNDSTFKFESFRYTYLAPQEILYYIMHKKALGYAYDPHIEQRYQKWLD